MKNKKLCSGIIGTVGMFAGVAMLWLSTSGVSTTGKRFAVAAIGYLSVFLATVYFGKAMTKNKKQEENNDKD